jgi:hypothetical protein
MLSMEVRQENPQNGQVVLNQSPTYLGDMKQILIFYVFRFNIPKYFDVLLYFIHLNFTLR